MKTIMIIFALLFSLNISYAMQVPLKHNSIEFKAVYSKMDSKAAIPKKAKKMTPLRRVFMIVQIVIYSIILFFIIALMVSKP